MKRNESRFCHEHLDGYIMPAPTGRTLSLLEWYSNVEKKSFENDSEQLMYLEIESRQEASFRSAYVAAVRANKRVSGLSKAECVAVTMYTVDDPPFFALFNEECRNGEWRKYITYSTVLSSACIKLVERDPVRTDVTLYLGLKNPSTFHVPLSPCYWPQFTSASLDFHVVKRSSQASKTFAKFESCRYGAKIEDLSLRAAEREVLIPPFEAFDYVETKKLFRGSAGILGSFRKGKMLHFRGSFAQPLFCSSDLVLLATLSSDELKLMHNVPHTGPSPSCFEVSSSGTNSITRTMNGCGRFINSQYLAILLSIHYIIFQRIGVNGGHFKSDH